MRMIECYDGTFLNVDKIFRIFVRQGKCIAIDVDDSYDLFEVPVSYGNIDFREDETASSVVCRCVVESISYFFNGLCGDFLTYEKLNEMTWERLDKFLEEKENE